MKRIYYSVLMFLIASFLVGCQADDVDVFGEEHEVYFEKFWMNAVAPGTEQADSTKVTFFFEPEDSQYVYADLVVCLSGRALTSEVTFGLKVIEELSTVKPENYELDDHYTFRPGTFAEGDLEIKDTIHVKLKRSEYLTQSKQGLRMVVELVPSRTTGVGQYERSRAIIFLTEDAVQPLWWNEEVTTVLLGSYSATKYKLFLNNVEGAYNLDEKMIKESPDQARKLVLEFKKWLSAHPGQKDEFGYDITLPV